MTAPLIAATNLEFRRGEDFSLTLPSFRMEAGQDLAVLGPSGSGKSTLLDLFCGVLQPTGGLLELFGQDTANLSQGQLDALRGNRIGLIFQEHNLLPFATVAQNIALGVLFSTERRQRVQGSLRDATAQLLDAMGLDPKRLLQRQAGQLSVGQRQRVAAARALLGAPDLIVADEPTSALDADNQARFMELLQSARKESGSALMLVSHNPDLVAGFGSILDLQTLGRAA